MDEGREVPEQGRRFIAAGGYHNVISSNVKMDEKGGTEGVTGYEMEESLWGFGSNRNHQLGWCLHRDVEPTPDEREIERDQIRQSVDKPTRLRIEGGGIFEACCGGNHTVFLQKKGDQIGGQVWTMGLGTSGRLGVPRPRFLSEKEARGEQIMHNSFPWTMETLLQESWLPKYEQNYNYTEVLLSRMEDAGHKKACQYTHEVMSHIVFKKWSLRDPVKVSFPNDMKIKRIACGVDHTLAITTMGSIYAWGLGSYGNLGTGSTEDETIPVKVLMPDVSVSIQVAAGMKHSMALLKDGTMYSWGHGGHGRLGQGSSKEASLSPREIKGSPGVGVQPMCYIAASESHSASVDMLGNVYTWGAGSYGRTGHGEEDIDEPIPKMVASLNGVPCTQIELGVLHSIVLTKNGTLHSWGTGCATGVMEPGSNRVQATPVEVRSDPTKDRSEQVIYQNRIVEIACGSFHSLALSYVGDLFVWGVEGQGRLGNGADQVEIPFPISVMSKKDMPTAWSMALEDASKGGARALQDDAAGEEEIEANADDLNKVKAVFCGGAYSMALLVKGDLWQWGSNEYGQMGNGSRADAFSPFMQSNIERRHKVAQVALGTEHVLIRLSMKGEGNMNILSWGRNDAGQLGRPTTEPDSALAPHPIESIKDASDVAAGEDHSAAITVSGELYTWGSVENGKLGLDGPATPGSFHTYPEQVTNIGQLVKVNCGAQHTAVINRRGVLYTWGAGWFGRLGHGNMSNQAHPKILSHFGQRIPDTEDEYEKVKAEQVRQVLCASYHTAIVTVDNSLWLVGRETCVCEPEHTMIPLKFDKIMEPDDKGRNKPIEVDQVVVGTSHTLVLSMQGNLIVFGDNYKGQLGLAEHEHILPVILKNRVLERAGRIRGIATGIYHTVVRMEDGDLYSWGLQNSGRLAQERQMNVPLDRKRPIQDPNKVDSAWEDRSAIPLEDDDHENEGEAKKEGEDKKEDSDDEKKPEHKEKELFFSLQELLRLEDKDQKEAALLAEESKLMAVYKGFFDHIFRLWDPPAGLSAEALAKMQQKGEIKNCEWYLRKLEMKMDRSLCRNLTRMDLNYDYPDLDKLTIHPDIQPKLLFYEELLWILQQQPCYLANVTRAEHFNPANGFTRSDVKGEMEQNFKPAIFKKVAGALFSELSDDRIRHLFMALIRLVMKYEVRDFYAKGRKPEDMFSMQDSTVVILLKIFVRHRVFKKSMHMPIIGEDPNSLLSLIERWTVKAPKKKGRGRSENNQSTGDEDLLFALSEVDLLEHEHIEGAESSGNKKEYMELLRENLAGHQRNFNRFLALNEAGKEEEQTENGGKKEIKFFCEWLSTFVFHDDVKALLKYVHNELDVVFQAKRESMADADVDELRKKLIIAPLTRLMMIAVMGEMLENHRHFFTPAMEEHMKKRWKDYLIQQNPTWGEAGQDKAIQKKIGKMSKQMHFNISNLGRLCTLSAFSEFTPQQGEAKAMGSKLVDFMQATFTERQVEKIEDETETALTIDLYTSHYDLKDHYVCLDTTDLLELSNVLWLFKDRIMLLDIPEDDRLYGLLDKIQPPKPPPSELDTTGPKSIRKRVAVIGIAGNQEDVTKDGDVILWKGDEEEFRENGLALPGTDVDPKLNLDIEETAIKAFSDKTGCLLGPKAEMRLLLHKQEDLLQIAIFALKDQVHLTPLEKDSPLHRESLTKQKWINEIRDLNEKNALSDYMDWYHKHIPWEKIPTVKKIPDLIEIKKRLWPPYMMVLVEKDNNQHNFLINHRFLEKQRDLCFCRECQAPIPRSLSPQNQRGRSELRLIKTYRAIQGEMLEGKYPFWELERLLSSPDLDHLRRNEFLMVKYDLEEQQKVFTQTMNSKAGSSAGANLIHVIKDIDQAKKNIDILRQHGLKEDRLSEFVKEALRHRKQHRMYLNAVQEGKKKIKDKQLEHEQKLKSLVNSLKWAVEASEEGSLPQLLKSKALDLGETLTMANLERQLRIQKKKQSDDEPLLYPSETKSLAYLRGKRVIATFGQGNKETKTEFSYIHFTFSMNDAGDWKVKAMHKRKAEERVLFQFEIGADKIAEFKRAGKTAKWPANNGMVIFNCFYLVQLLSRIASSMS